MKFFSFEKKDLVFLFLLLLFIDDTVYSYYQHSFATIDGAIPLWHHLKMPTKEILHHPFGFKILQTGENCAVSNRFLCSGQRLYTFAIDHCIFNLFYRQ
ncbi:MAG: hypothetical protein H7282_07350 [Cytophagaceae bacterium]|nr:hypothetical protein [Cytophagaceae bacterium]